MRIDGISLAQTQKGLDAAKKTSGGDSFAQLLKGALENVNDMQKKSDHLSQEFALGNVDSIHKVMIATEKARLAMDLTLVINNKVLETYKELMRLQF